MRLKNLKQLKDDMLRKSWTICSFIFLYKNIKYIVLVKRFVGTEKRESEYALVKLHFIKADELMHDLLVEANSQRLIASTQTLIKYFNIEYKDNLGDVLGQLTDRLGKAIPTSISENASEQEKMLMVRSLSTSDFENPNKIYCNGVRRNPNNGKRSEYNSDKTKILRPSLFEYFRNEPGVSFCYYDDPSMNRDDLYILQKFSER